jgi:hypothetical protein
MNWTVLTNTVEEVYAFMETIPEDSVRMYSYFQNFIKIYNARQLELKAIEEEKMRVEQERIRREEKIARKLQVQASYERPSTRRARNVNYKIEDNTDEFTGPEYEFNESVSDKENRRRKNSLRSTSRDNDSEDEQDELVSDSAKESETDELMERESKGSAVFDEVSNNSKGSAVFEEVSSKVRMDEHADMDDLIEAA